jgi:hypothetical protein
MATNAATTDTDVMLTFRAPAELAEALTRRVPRRQRSETIRQAVVAYLDAMPEK